MTEIVIEIDSQFEEKDPAIIRAILAYFEQKKKETQTLFATCWAIPVKEAMLVKIEREINIVLEALHQAEEREKKSQKRIGV